VGLLAALALAGTAGAGDAKPKLPAIDEKTLGDAKAARLAADVLEAAYEGKQPPEAMRMLLAILRGSRMGPKDGWFGPAQTRYTWQWLARLHGVDPDTGAISRKMFRGPDALFARLDRDHDGRITPADLDWSDSSPYVQQTALARNWFRAIGAGSSGQLSRKDLMDFFDRAAKGKDHLSFDEFRDALLEGAAPSPRRGATRRPPDRAGSMRFVLVRGLFAGEIGSMNEGPRVGQPAPNFTLRTIDGKETVQLAKVIGKKPVVLVFGNYTCRPFCSSYPAVEPVCKRFGKEAVFLMIYVREAHPSDGWSMGATIRQPRTFEERVSVAGQLVKELTPTVPVLVDEINDPVGHAYSGMPSRLYVIDTKGIVAYKNGRGPFGFRVGEMEQALVMALLEAHQQSEKAKSAEVRP
jgi:hypothetical protein